MDAVVERENMQAALRRVKRNKGAAGVDGMSVGELDACLREEWPRIKQELLEDRYLPQPVLGVEIPKPGGKGMRQLGIPTVLDRCHQAMVKNALEPEWEARFEPTSYGFRPGRSCQDAMSRIHGLAQSRQRKKWVIDADIKGHLIISATHTC